MTSFSIPRFTLLMALALGGCHYDPEIPEGVITCRNTPECPTGYDCRQRPDSEQFVCCHTARCGFPAAPDPEPDASVKPDAASPPDLAGDRAVALDMLDAAVDAPVVDGGVDGGGDGRLVSPDATADLTPDAGPDGPLPCPAATGGPTLVRAGSFCVDSTEVTNEQYRAFLTAKGTDTSGQGTACKAWNTTFVPKDETVPWPFLAGTEKHPVVNVDWCDATAFCVWSGKRLCGKQGGGRLPSWMAAASIASQWVNACTGGGRVIYPYGSNFNRSKCNTDAPAESGQFIEDVGHRPTCEGGYPGLFDMSGNVEEWLDGCDKDAGKDDMCASAGSSTNMGVLKPEDLSCSGSVYGSPRNDTYFLRGFRCCAD
jgi:sulfatase modifying factor 1